MITRSKSKLGKESLLKDPHVYRPPQVTAENSQGPEDLGAMIDKFERGELKPRQRGKTVWVKVQKERARPDPLSSQIDKDTIRAEKKEVPLSTSSKRSKAALEAHPGHETASRPTSSILTKRKRTASDKGRASSRHASQCEGPEDIVETLDAEVDPNPSSKRSRTGRKAHAGTETQPGSKGSILMKRKRSATDTKQAEHRHALGGEREKSIAEAPDDAADPKPVSKRARFDLEAHGRNDAGAGAGTGTDIGSGLTGSTATRRKRPAVNCEDANSSKVKRQTSTALPDPAAEGPRRTSELESNLQTHTRQPELHEQATHEQATHEQATHEQATHEQATHEQATHEQATHEQATHEQATHEQATNQQDAHEQAAHQQATHEQATHEQATHEQATHEQATHEQATHQQATHEQATNQQDAHEQAAHQQAADQQDAHQQDADQQDAHQQDAPSSAIEVAEESFEKRMQELAKLQESKNESHVPIPPEGIWGTLEIYDPEKERRPRKRAKKPEILRDNPSIEDWARSCNDSRKSRPDWCTRFIFRSWSEMDSHQGLETSGYDEPDKNGDRIFTKTYSGTFKSNPQSTLPPVGHLGRKRLFQNLMDGLFHEELGTRGNRGTWQNQRLFADQDVTTSSEFSAAELHERSNCSCFISFTMSWQEALRSAERMDGSRTRTRSPFYKPEYFGKRTYITVARADVAAALGDWKMLKPMDEVKKYGVTSRRGIQSVRGITENEVLILERLPRPAIIKTYELATVRNWNAKDVLIDLGLSDKKLSSRNWCRD